MSKEPSQLRDIEDLHEQIEDLEELSLTQEMDNGKVFYRISSLQDRLKELTN